MSMISGQITGQNLKGTMSCYQLVISQSLEHNMLFSLNYWSALLLQNTLHYIQKIHARLPDNQIQQQLNWKKSINESTSQAERAILL